VLSFDPDAPLAQETIDLAMRLVAAHRGDQLADELRLVLGELNADSPSPATLVDRLATIVVALTRSTSMTAALASTWSDDLQDPDDVLLVTWTAMLDPDPHLDDADDDAEPRAEP